MKPLYTSVTMKKKLTASWDKYFLMIRKKKRDKCIQMHYIGKSYVTTVTMEKHLITLKKKCYKCMQMHYIGKSYVTNVYKFDDGFL